MNTPQPISPVTSPQRAITYELTRWDLFFNWMTVIFRNRILQIFVLVAFVLNAWIVLGPGFVTRPILYTIVEGGIYSFVFLAFLGGCQCVLGFANAFFLKQRGVAGRHTLEISDQGLIERTEFNETLHRWPSISRVVTLGGYVFIYVSDNNSHQIPKRCFPNQELEIFLNDLRQHAQH